MIAQAFAVQKMLVIERRKEVESESELRDRVVVKDALSLNRSDHVDDGAKRRRGTKRHPRRCEFR